MPKIRIRDAAQFLSVSDDTVRRWIEAGVLPVETDASNRKVVDGRALALFAREHASPAADPSRVERSARNRFVGLVTEVISDTVIRAVSPPAATTGAVSITVVGAGECGTTVQPDAFTYTAAPAGAGGSTGGNLAATGGSDAGLGTLTAAGILLLLGGAIAIVRRRRLA